MPESGFLMNAQKNQPGGVPTLDTNGLLQASQLPNIPLELVEAEALGSVASHESKTNPHAQYAIITHSHTADSIGAIALSLKGAANGVASLVGGVVPVSQLPAPIITSVNGKTGAVLLTANEVNAIAISEKGVANGVASLSSSGTIPEAQLPPIAITDTFVVNTQAAMLALTAQVGDVAVRTDLLKTFILKTSPSSAVNSWQELPTPVDTILSVNNKTGVVVLNAQDVGAEPSGAIANHSTSAEVHSISSVSGLASALESKLAQSVINLGTGRRHTRTSSLPLVPTIGDSWDELDPNGGFLQSWFWSGTYWLSRQIYEFNWAGDTDSYTSAINILPTFNIFLLQQTISTYSSNNHTTSTYWSINLSRTNTYNSATNIYSINTNSDLGSQWNSRTNIINLHIDVIALVARFFRYYFIPTGSPKTMNIIINLKYRIARRS